MEKTNTKTSIFYVALLTLGILTIPLLAMFFTNEVNWDVFDFIGMGALIFCAGCAYFLISSFAPNIFYKLATVMAVGSTLFMVWANLSVGLIGAGPHIGNLMYIAVVAVVIVGSILSLFSPQGMERTMFATALSIVLLATVAIILNLDNYPGVTIKEIVGVNGFFAALFGIAALLYHASRADIKRRKQQEENQQEF